MPFAFVDNGLRWHVRAFDRKRQIFTDFVINRIAKPKLLHSSPPLDTESKDVDIQWNRIVEMHLVPHPRLKHPETIQFEYGMEKRHAQGECSCRCCWLCITPVEC